MCHSKINLSDSTESGAAEVHATWEVSPAKDDDEIH